MSVVSGSFFGEVKSFAERHPLICISTLGLAVIGYSIGVLAGRAVSWIAECAGPAKKTDVISRKSFDSMLNSNKTGLDTTFRIDIESSSIILQADKSRASFEIINWVNADPQIRDQVKEMWPKRVEKFTQGVPEGDRIICITEGDKLVGCVALEQLTITEPPGLVQEVGVEKVYKLDIKINDEYQGRGFGRTVFNYACNLVVKEGSLVFLVDMAAQGVGDRLYGGEKTRELFDVYHVLKGARGEYLFKKKTHEKNSLNYLKIDPSNIYVFFTCVESPEGINHLINYLKSHPEDVSLVDPSILKTCYATMQANKDSWSKDQLEKYSKDFEILKALIKGVNQIDVI